MFNIKTMNAIAEKGLDELRAESCAVSPDETRWILCPVCHGKTRTQVRRDTVLENFPLFCPKCKGAFLISLRANKTEYGRVF